MYWFLLYFLLSSISVLFPLELCSLYHWRWKRYIHGHNKVPGEGFFRWLFFWPTVTTFVLISDCILEVVCVSDKTLPLFVHVNVYWQLAPCHVSVPFLPALGLNNTERKASSLWRRFARHCNSLFLLFKKTTPTMYSFVTAVAEGICSLSPTQNWSLTLWAVWKNPVGLLHVNIFQGQ